MSRLNLTNAQTGDGLDAANDQPAKTLSKHTANFIAAAASFAIADAGYLVLCVVVLVQVVLMALAGVLQ